MKQERTTVIFFDDLTKQAQKRIVAVELEKVVDGAVSHVVVKPTDLTPFGYDPDPCKQEMIQDMHVKVRYGGHDHHWLMVWDCTEAEFQTLMEEGKE